MPWIVGTAVPDDLGTRDNCSMEVLWKECV